MTPTYLCVIINFISELETGKGEIMFIRYTIQKNITRENGYNYNETFVIEVVSAKELSTTLKQMIDDGLINKKRGGDKTTVIIEES